MPRRQIVFYHKPTGRVLKTSFGGSITKRTQILRYLPSSNLRDVGFYYEFDDAEVIPGSDLVLFLHNGLPPYLCDSQSRPKAIFITIERNKKMILRAGKIKVDFEYGMGDQVMQLEVYKAFLKEMPEIEFIAGVDPVYQNIFPYLSPKPTLAPWGRSSAYPGFLRIELNHQHILWDPRCGTYGKSCLFGAELGLNEVREEIEFRIPSPEREILAAQAGIDLDKIKRPFLGIHIHCNSRMTANWPLQEAIALSDIWHNETGGDVVFLGNEKKILHYSPGILYHSFPCDWASTGAIILSLDLFVGVDSGPMHLARAGKINQIVIWGGSGPQNICGREPQWFDIMGEVDCVDQICCSCPRGRPLCIELTTAQRVWAVIKKEGAKRWKPSILPF
jgi:ADP-heptose:LPS heptosyltransferase